LVDAARNNGVPTVYFADMGYASYNNFAHVIENRRFFLTRCNDKRFGGILGHSVKGLKEVDIRVERILTRTQSKKKHSRSELSERYRHICLAVPMDYIDENRSEYDISLRIIRFEITPGCFGNIITNLPE